jgi:hypothetical protein
VPAVEVNHVEGIGGWLTHQFDERDDALLGEFVGCQPEGLSEAVILWDRRTEYWRQVLLDAGRTVQSLCIRFAM